jgi:hypothetical protein
VLDAPTHRPALPQLCAWQWGLLALAVVTLVPVAWFAYADTLEAARVARVQLIEHYRLWETAPDYAGTPQAWTRFAAWLLDTDQLMERVRVKHGALADQIEIDFRRDLLLVCGRTIGAYLLLWLTPLALLYGAGRFYRRRRQR